MTPPVSVDYNLLRPLRALLEERSVTRAAERLHVSQPTASQALQRLRAHFGDPLLVRRGSGYELTPLGQRLAQALPGVLGEIDRVFLLQSRFDPAESTRTFVIAAVDHVVTRLAPVLNSILKVEAPGVTMEFPAADSRLVNGAPDTLRTIDGIILPYGYLVDQPHLELFNDAWVCVVDADSDIPDRPSAEELLARPWVNTLSLKDGMSPARKHLLLQGMEVRVAAVTPHFQVIPALLAGTDRVSMLPESLARRMVGYENIRILPDPFGLEPLRDAFWWHREREHDAEHVWLRMLLRRVRDQIIT